MLIIAQTSPVVKLKFNYCSHSQDKTSSFLAHPSNCWRPLHCSCLWEIDRFYWASKLLIVIIMITLHYTSWTYPSIKLPCAFCCFYFGIIACSSAHLLTSDCILFGSFPKFA